MKNERKVSKAGPRLIFFKVIMTRDKLDYGGGS